MLEKNLIIFVSAVAIVLICWMLAEHWFYSFGVLSEEKASKLGVFNCISLRVEEFFGAVNHKKNFRVMRLEKEMENFQLKADECIQGNTKKEFQKKTYDSVYAKRKRRYNIKEDM